MNLSPLNALCLPGQAVKSWETNLKETRVGGKAQAEHLQAGRVGRAD